MESSATHPWRQCHKRTDGYVSEPPSVPWAAVNRKPAIATAHEDLFFEIRQEARLSMPTGRDGDAET